MSKLILDLCGGTGAWSKPYKEAGYDVRNITLPDYDIRTYRPPENVYGILAAPPCTMFSFARTKAKKQRDLKEGMKIVRACLNITWSYMEIRQDTKRRILPLKFWALENPNGMLKYFLGKPTFEFNPYDFGDMYKKKTCLWGWFNKPIKTFFVKPNTLKFTDMKSIADMESWKKVKTRRACRSITPQGFAKAFFEANQ